MPRPILREFLITLVITSTFACGGKKDDSSSSQPADPKTNPTSPKTTTDPNPEPPKAEAPKYSPEVAKKVPADKKAKFVELLKKATEGPKDPMLKGGLEKSLKALEG